MSPANGPPASPVEDPFTAAGAPVAAGATDRPPGPADRPPGLLRSPLDAWHRAAGAKMAEFGGWNMPIDYPASAGGGVLREHAAVRTAVGCFDVSHLGKLIVRGPGAAAFVDSCLTNSLSRISPGQAQYTLCCDEATGGTVDDLIAYLRGDDEVLLVPNAANAAEVARRLRDAAPAGVQVTDVHRDFAVLAVQGPLSSAVLERVGLPVPARYMSFLDAEYTGRSLSVCRSGYTGERGYELVVTAAGATTLWTELIAAATALGGRACGLGARDTLRLEMGYPLHGHELSLAISPLQARLGWAVGWDKPAFWGRAALLAERQRGPTRLLWGLRATDRSIPRAGCLVSVPGSVPGSVGEVTSGSFSPTLQVGIGLGLLAAGAVEPGTPVRVDLRGRPAAFEVVRPPFVPASPR